MHIDLFDCRNTNLPGDAFGLNLQLPEVTQLREFTFSDIANFSRHAVYLVTY